MPDYLNNELKELIISVEHAPFSCCVDERCLGIVEAKLREALFWLEEGQKRHKENMDAFTLRNRGGQG